MFKHYRSSECHGVCPKYIHYEKENAIHREKRRSEINGYKLTQEAAYRHRMHTKRK